MISEGVGDYPENSRISIINVRPDSSSLKYRHYYSPYWAIERIKESVCKSPNATSVIQKTLLNNCYYGIIVLCLCQRWKTACWANSTIPEVTHFSYNPLVKTSWFGQRYFLAAVGNGTSFNLVSWVRGWTYSGMSYPRFWEAAMNQRSWDQRR